MPRLKLEVQIRKETALEALRDALRMSNRTIRPRMGCPGYGAVVVAMSHWLGLEFSGVSEKERLATLRAATQWDNERHSKAGPHARVDVAKCAELTRELVSVLKAEDDRAAAAKSETAAQRATAGARGSGSGRPARPRRPWRTPSPR